MNQSQNSLQIKTLESYTTRAPQQVLQAIQRASDTSGVDFSYLVQQAAAESNFDTDAKAKTSSATGLYQFIDSTWLSMVERYGNDYGIDTAELNKSEVLALRNDAEKASFMAAAFASENETFLNTHWGGDIGATELYFAHFMGAGGATSFLKARDETPLTQAADLFPKAASANRNVFYDPETGKARTIEEVYQFFDKKFQIQGTEENSKPDTQVAQNNNAETMQYTAYNALFRPNTDSPIMQRAQQMRAAESLYQSEDSTLSALYTLERVDGFQTQNSLFTGLLASPIDLLLLTQDVTNTARSSKDEA
ncbi:MAG: transglycosylase SLT domain-containing protein [Alphaproteobacteria bacterium]